MIFKPKNNISFLISVHLNMYKQKKKRKSYKTIIYLNVLLFIYFILMYYKLYLIVCFMYYSEIMNICSYINKFLTIFVNNYIENKPFLIVI
jgi:hypothetical protein